MQKTTISAPTGQIFSFESFGTLDGPGIRFVVFFAGCPLRCQFCHNIDAVTMTDPLKMTADEILEKIIPNKPYFDFSGGGITVSGGEPFFQPEFLIDFLRKCKAAKFHTTVDTSLCTPQQFIPTVAEHTDLFMVSLKHFDDATHIKLTSASNRLILKNVRLLSSLQKRIWFRFLILPGVTDTPKNISALIAFLKTVDFELIELLPYQRIGISKWKDAGIPYKLNATKIPTAAEIQKVKISLEQEGFRVLVNE